MIRENGPYVKGRGSFRLSPRRKECYRGLYPVRSQQGDLLRIGLMAHGQVMELLEALRQTLRHEACHRYSAARSVRREIGLPAERK